MLKNLLTILFLSISLSTFAQTGSIKGIIKDSVSKEDIIGASIFLEGTTQGGATDIDGSFAIKNVKPGTYNVIINYISYKKRTISGIEVTAGQETDMGNLEIAEEIVQGEEVVVTGIRQKSTEAAVITEIKNADQVVSGISSEQISKGQDRDASQVIQRIPGVSVVDGRFIMIRGLNDRYNSVWLNDVNAPSTETDKKAFSFDMVPSSLIERVLVFKTASPELPGDFAGGLVKIYTKNVPTPSSLNVNVGLGYRQGTTGQNFTKDKSSTDFLGFDDGSRGIPSGYQPFTRVNENNASQVDANSQLLKNNWQTNTKSALPDGRLSINYTGLIKVKRGQLGVVTSANYSNQNTTFNIARKFTTDAYGKAPETRLDKQYTNQVRVGGMLNFTYLINDKHKIEFRNFVNQSGKNQYTGRDAYSGPDDNLSQLRKQVIIMYDSRTIYTSQLAGTHTINKDRTLINWIVGYGYTNRNAPDLRRTTFVPDASNPGSWLVQPATNANDPQNSNRLYQKLSENTGTVALNLTQKINLKKGIFALTEVNAGTYIEQKSRHFTARSLGYVSTPSAVGDSIHAAPLGSVYSQQNIHYANGGWSILEDGGTPSNEYTASNRLMAFYGKLNFTVGTKIKVSGGLRFENNVQTIKTAINLLPTTIENPTNMFLPSVNTSYNFNDKNLIRLSYGKTLNRPEFREWAPYGFYDFN